MLDKEREMRVDRQTGTENADSSASIRGTVTTFVSPSPSLSYSAPPPMTTHIEREKQARHSVETQFVRGGVPIIKIPVLFIQYTYVSWALSDFWVLSHHRLEMRMTGFGVNEL